MNGLRLADVSKTYGNGKEGGVVAVRGLSLDVNRGESLVILGPSGCGKTTMLRLIAGLEQLTGGDILLHGRSLTNVPPHRRPLALVFQNHAVYPHMTAERNLTYALRVRRFDAGTIRRRLEETAVLLRISGEELRRRPSELSGGQKQRVALGRALMLRPELLLLDEPFSQLDQQLRVELRSELRSIRKAVDSTLVVVTHDQADAAALGDRIALMNHGRIEQVGTARDLYRRPDNLFVARFMSPPPMNLIRGRIEQRGDDLCFREEVSGVVSFQLTPEQQRILEVYGGRHVIAGVRPDGISLKAYSDSEGTTLQGCAEITAVEDTGAAVWVTLNTGTHPMRCEASPEDCVAVGDRAALMIDASVALFFDPVSEQRISV